MRVTGILRKGLIPEPLRKFWTPLQRRVDAYNEYMQNNYPKLYELQTGLTTGSKNTLIEGKDYGKVALRTRLYGQPVQSLTYKEIALRYQYPRDLLKLGPVLLIIALPFSTIALLPIIYFFPRYFLTRHFWTAEQRRYFSLLEVRKRLQAAPEVAGHLEAAIGQVENHAAQQQVLHVLAHLKRGQHIHEKEIVDIEEIFTRKPFRFQDISFDYLDSLARLNNVYPWYAARSTVRLAEMDRYLVTNPDVKLDNQDVRDAVLLRCLNPNGDQEVLRDFLDVWTSTSAALGRTFLTREGPECDLDTASAHTSP